MPCSVFVEIILSQLVFVVVNQTGSHSLRFFEVHCFIYGSEQTVLLKLQVQKLQFFTSRFFCSILTLVDCIIIRRIEIARIFWTVCIPKIRFSNIVHSVCSSRVLWIGVPWVGFRIVLNLFEKIVVIWAHQVSGSFWFFFVLLVSWFVFNLVMG